MHTTSTNVCLTISQQINWCLVFPINYLNCGSQPILIISRHTYRIIQCFFALFIITKKVGIDISWTIQLQHQAKSHSGPADALSVQSCPRDDHSNQPPFMWEPWHGDCTYCNLHQRFQIGNKSILIETVFKTVPEVPGGWKTRFVLTAEGSKQTVARLNVKSLHEESNLVAV